ncbi:ribonuclease kappa-B [Lingula anatina]|uniref:Ribonuclease kappa-B n=1 Tax=Lingula anatina TaxID=7574 RepID=A0A1S3IFU7_LINAN|nr:ribonuclease kappa-B [Lingula anatina]|eukprot:XP_013397023.1 ribonuclease kappa-B [Lingula anatina]
MGCPVCGPKLSLCGIITSAWGIVMLILMGVFFIIKSPAFIEDVNFDHDKVHKAGTVEAANNLIEEAYQTSAYNCFIAGGIYVVILIFSVVQFKWNMRASYVMS